MYLIGFDFDGVIIDSREVMKKAWENVQNSKNVSFALLNLIFKLNEEFQMKLQRK